LHNIIIKNERNKDVDYDLKDVEVLREEYWRGNPLVLQDFL
jgi:hypothetical protein